MPVSSQLRRWHRSERVDDPQIVSDDHGGVGKYGRMSADLAVDLALARQIGDMAGEIALRYFRTNVRHELKVDGSPVTEADLAVERAVLDVLASERPGDGVLSEERGALLAGRLIAGGSSIPLTGRRFSSLAPRGGVPMLRLRSAARSRWASSHVRPNTDPGGLRRVEVPGHHQAPASTSRRGRLSTAPGSAVTPSPHRGGKPRSRKSRLGCMPIRRSSS